MSLAVYFFVRPGGGTHLLHEKLICGRRHLKSPALGSPDGHFLSFFTGRLLRPYSQNSLKDPLLRRPCASSRSQITKQKAISAGLTPTRGAIYTSADKHA